MIKKCESTLSVKEALKMAWYEDVRVTIGSVIETEDGCHIHGKNEEIKGRAGQLLRGKTPYDDFPVLAFHAHFDHTLYITYCEN